MLKYKAPKLHKHATEWVVEYSIQHPDTEEWHRFKERKGLNKKGVLKKDREKNAADLINSILNNLKAGNINPWAVVEPVAVLDVKSALLSALEYKKPDVEESTHTEYKYSLDAFLRSCDALQYSSINITQFKRRHIVNALDHLRATGKSDYRWNITKARISALLTVLMEREIIEFNPSFRAIKSKVLPEPTKFDPPTDEEKARIDRHLYNNHRRLFVFKSLIYTAGIRPGEILTIQILRINLESDYIDIPAKDTKVKRYSKRIPITPDMKELLIEHIKGAAPTDYLFSKMLKPGPKKISYPAVDYHWEKSVKIELGINRNLYAEKHRGTDDKLLSGIELDDLRQIYGHTNKRMTEKYASTLKSKAHEEIKKKSPGIIPK